MSSTRPPKKPTLGLDTLSAVLGTAPLPSAELVTHAPTAIPAPELSPSRAHRERAAFDETARLGQAHLNSPADPASEAAAWKVITVRLSLDDYRWLRQQAHEASMQTGHRADASALLRRLVAEARNRQG